MKEAASEWDVLAVLPKRSSPDLIFFLEQIGVRYELIDAEIDTGDAPSLMRKLARTKSRIRSEFTTFRYLLKFDLRSSILHMESAPWQSWILYTALCARGANVFVTMHNALPGRPRWRVALWKSRLHFLSRLSGFHIFASNKDTRNKLKGWVNDAFWEKIRVTYTCVNPIQIKQATEMTFDKAAVRDKFGIASEKFIVLCVAQFIDRKGRWVFLEAAKEVVRATDDIDFVWVSPELPNRADMEKIGKFGVGHRFRMIKSREIGTSRVEILSFFRVGDLFVLPSFLEGLPISLLEAMAMGVPVISTDINAIPEAVKNDETGVIVPPGDPKLLARRIIELARDPDRMNRLATSGQEFVLKTFDERIASRIAINEYNECFKDSTL
jgi:glycosyltransferase involved in cell wall biosynthesis